MKSDHLYEFSDARLLMAPDIIWVYDGIVNKIEVKQKEDKTLYMLILHIRLLIAQH